MALPDYEGWACFVAVADGGSFTAAAAALGLSKASVSKAVTRLEASLGITLLHRSSRVVAVSTAGAGLLDEARAMVAAATAATEAARGDRVDLAGPIRLAAPMSFGIKVLGPPLAAFLDRHPAVEIEVLLSDARNDPVAEGIDLTLRIAPLADSSLLARTIAPVAASVIASPAYLKKHGVPKHPPRCPTSSRPTRWRRARSSRSSPTGRCRSRTCTSCRRRRGCARPACARFPTTSSTH